MVEDGEVHNPVGGFSAIWWRRHHLEVAGSFEPYHSIEAGHCCHCSGAGVVLQSLSRGWKGQQRCREKVNSAQRFRVEGRNVHKSDLKRHRVRMDHPVGGVLLRGSSALWRRRRSSIRAPPARPACGVRDRQPVGRGGDQPSTLSRAAGGSPTTSAVRCVTAVELDFTFAAVHRAGVDNVLMDWASRPGPIYTSSSPTRSRQRGTSRGWRWWVVVWVVWQTRASPLGPRPRPLFHPISLSHISSRCLKFESQDNSTRWRLTSSGSSPCA